MFRADNARAKNLRTNNSGIMFNYPDTGLEYGELKEIFSHAYSPGSPPRYYGKIEWYTKVRMEHGGRCQLVKRDPGSAGNRNHQYEWLAQACGQNVVFFPWDLRRPNKPELACIYRNSKNRDLDVY